MNFMKIFFFAFSLFISVPSIKEKCMIIINKQFCNISFTALAKELRQLDEKSSSGCRKHEVNSRVALENLQNEIVTIFMCSSFDGAERKNKQTFF